MKVTVLVSMGAAALLLCTNAIRADEWNQQLTLTFNNPVEVPGQVLAAGTYVFKVGVGDVSDDRSIVRIYNKDGTHLYGLFMTVPDHSLVRSNKPTLEFEHGLPGSPEIIYAWFYPGDKVGHEFVYPKAEAVRLAKANNRAVASMSDEFASQGDLNAMKHARVKAVMPTGEEVDTVTVFGNPAHDR
jgi:hypothetical protein